MAPRSGPPAAAGGWRPHAVYNAGASHARSKMLHDTQADHRRAALETWLGQVLEVPPLRIAPASADASFRRYFRVWCGEATWIAMDAPPDKEDLQPYVRVSRLLAEAGVNVPRVIAIDPAQGFLLLTDLGSRLYLDALRAGEDADALYGDAIAALVRLQAHAGAGAAGLPDYDAARLRQEMDLFPAWFLGRHLGLELSQDERSLIDGAFDLLVRSALAQPQVLVHRDYHSRNLMVCPDNPGVLDFQDAVIGAISYDLVSLLKDCYICWPRERVLGWVDRYLLAARRAGLGPHGSRADFIRSVDLMGAQRHLKVLGIFARLWYRDGKVAYLSDLPLVLDYTLAVTRTEPLLAGLGRFLEERVVPAFPAAQARARAAR